MICECSLICYNAKAAGLAKTSVISAAKLPQLLLGAVLGWGAFVHRVQLAVLGEQGEKNSLCSSSSVSGAAGLALPMSPSPQLSRG